MSNISAVKTFEKPRLSLRAKTIYTIAAIAGAVVLPQIFHTLGTVSGLGTSVGEAFLPMHLPIILAGLLAGPFVGAVSGFFAPIISYALSGMPLITMLPFMAIELCAYGLFAGLLSSVKMPSAVKVLIVQIAGRLVKASAIAAAFYIFGSESVQVASVFTSVLTGIFGIALQLVIIPLIIYRTENSKKYEN